MYGRRTDHNTSYLTDRTMGSSVLDYVGRHFNPDKYVFHTLMALALIFMVLYSVGTSVPAWYVLEEQTTNFSACQSADRYVETHVRRSWNEKVTTVNIAASLWFLNLKVNTPGQSYKRFMPFLFAEKEPLHQYIQNGLLIENILPKSLTTVLTFVFLFLGVLFTFCASTRPSRLVYYGLSSIMIVASITCWVTIAITASEQYLLSAAADLCLRRGAVKTSFLLQMVTGSAGMLAFVFGCVLIHVAVLINDKVKAQSDRPCQDDFDIVAKVQSLYGTKQKEGNALSKTFIV